LFQKKIIINEKVLD